MVQPTETNVYKIRVMGKVLIGVTLPDKDGPRLGVTVHSLSQSLKVALPIEEIMRIDGFWTRDYSEDYYNGLMVDSRYRHLWTDYPYLQSQFDAFSMSLTTDLIIHLATVMRDDIPSQMIKSALMDEIRYSFPGNYRDSLDDWEPPTPTA